MGAGHARRFCALSPDGRVGLTRGERGGRAAGRRLGLLSQGERCRARRYVEQFDQAAMLEMTRVVSAEGAQLVEAQTAALFGDLKALQRQMQARMRMG